MFIEIRSWNQMKYNAFLANTQYTHKYNVILNKTVTKRVTILTKQICLFLNENENEKYFT